MAPLGGTTVLVGSVLTPRREEEGRAGYYASQFAATELMLFYRTPSLEAVVAGLSRRRRLLAWKASNSSALRSGLCRMRRTASSCRRLALRRAAGFSPPRFADREHWCVSVDDAGGASCNSDTSCTTTDRGLSPAATAASAILIRHHDAPAPGADRATARAGSIARRIVADARSASAFRSGRCDHDVVTPLTQRAAVSRRARRS